MAVQTHWRLAAMFDAPRRDIAALETALAAAGGAIRAAAGGFPVRIGLDDGRTMTGDRDDDYDLSAWRPVHGAIEVSVPNADCGAIPGICRALSPIVAGLAEPGSIEAMTGPMHHMVPVRAGGAFLSLSFRRFPGTTEQQFRDWWLLQHSQVAIPVLGEDMLAYDQVHVDQPSSREAAAAFGVPYVEYDAYDNLTYRDYAGFLRSVADAAGMNTIADDEIGRIDNNSRRHAFMREVP